MIVRMSHDQEARFRKAVQRAVSEMARRDGVESTATLLSVTEHSVRRWSDGDWPSYPNAVRIAPILGVKP